ncbi:beta-lactamase [Rhodococcus opacus PD630]|uniref:serine hydrolase n=1 Tax=Rhodococcus opacus TaxID=37919 RepID=UPI00029CD2D6|nr:serine hydrolase [Rhodococcus opacus]AHK31399.1 Beta-lactamase regulatory protein BlaB [Rhodococcus opacus PD630]EHI43077.1 beta-lactamase [Rhodococcus opacus PD630]UDG93986.1 class A beta-lactamase-related serine hydrolase [Rhodococcus opacus PD630]
MTVSAEKRIRDVFADAGCTGWLHARRVGTPIDDGGDIAVGADDLVVLASVYKLPLLVALCRAFESGELSPTATVRINPADCTPGPTGVSTFRDPVVLSWRDLAMSMMTVSDNAAADLVLGQVGLESVERALSELGMTSTRIIGGTADAHRSLVIDAHAHTTAEAFAALADNDEAWTVSAYDPSYASATTPRELTSLLDAIWTGRAVPGPQGEFVRHVMSAQIWQHRIRSGFPYSEVDVAGKTGTIGAIRNEVAVVTFPGETPVAVAVFTRAARTDPVLPVVDAAIGHAARIAVTELRSGRVD